MKIKSPLEGMLVIDWTIYHQGPAGGMFLADLGAEVIHVEQRGRGDLMRGLGMIFGFKLILPSGRQPLFEDLNRNKRSLSLDLAKPKGRELMYRLVEKADVFLTNMRPKAVRKLGMAYETLAGHNAKLIYGHATSFGERGPDGEAAGMELMAFARSGAMMASGTVGDPPTVWPLGSGDRIGGIFLAMGAITALLVRERTGEGQYFTTSQLGGMLSMQASAIMTTNLTGQSIRANRRERASNPLYNYYRCSDGRWIALGLNVDPDGAWPRFCRAIGRPDLIEDPMFSDYDLRAKNCERLVSLLDDIFAKRTCTEWETVLGAGEEMVFTRLNELADLGNDPQVLANEYMVPFEHPVLGSIKQVTVPIRFAKTPWRMETEAPECGQHTEEILTELLGHTWEEIGLMQDEGII